MFSWFRKKPKAELINTVMTFNDPAFARLLLEQVRPLLASGFANPEIDQVLNAIASTPPGGNRLLQFSVLHEGRASDMQIEVSREDGALPATVIFRCTQELTFHLIDERCQLGREFEDRADA